MLSSSPTNSNRLKPLNLQELNSFKTNAAKKEKILNSQPIECILCTKQFILSTESEEKTYLAHLIAIHKVVIADVNLIGNLKEYLAYWRTRLSSVKLEEVCFVIATNTGENDDIEKSENFYLLSDTLPEEKLLRERLNIYKLEKALKQQELERNDNKYERVCLFCETSIGTNRSDIIYHMADEHNFNIGNPDNIVYFDQFYLNLKQRLDQFKCLFCDKVFYNTQVLKEHMRKKMHKCIDSKNKEFDKFYIINYLEYSKIWKDIKLERDQEDSLFDHDQSIEEWNEPAQVYFCLFCDNALEEEKEILEHMITEHKFDLIEINASHQLSFYNQVKLLNYIRRQVYLKTCFVCKKETESLKELRKHLSENEHIKEFPDPETWDQPEYYFSTFEDDSLLCLLDDSAYEKDESKFKVIPEEYDIEINDDVMNTFKDLKMN